MYYGPADGYLRMPLSLFVYFMFGFTAPNHCMARIETNVGFGRVRWKVRVRPFAVIPEMCAVVLTPFLPAQFANCTPPTTILSSWSKQPYCAYIWGLRIRSQARSYDLAVTGEPSLNFSPLRMWNA